MITNASANDRSTNTAVKPVILVVDDSRVIRLALKKMLQKEYTIIEAGDGEEAWNLLLDNEAIQVVFSDLSIPELDGLELLERIRSSEHDRMCKIPFILLTGNENDEKVLQRAEDYGVTDLIAKPFQSGEIKDRARTYTRNLTDTEIHSISTPSLLDDIADSVDNLSSIDQLLAAKGRKVVETYVRAENTDVDNSTQEDCRQYIEEENETGASNRSAEYSKKGPEKSALALKIEEHARNQEARALVQQEDEHESFALKIEEHVRNQGALTLVQQEDEHESLLAFDVNQRVRSSYKDGQGSMEETEMIRHALEKKLATERKKQEASCQPLIRFFVSVLDRINALPWVNLDNYINNVLKRNAR